MIPSSRLLLRSRTTSAVRRVPLSPYASSYNSDHLIGRVVERKSSSACYHHRACGYLAGLHSFSSDTASSEEERQFDSFESAWDAITLVPRDLLDDFEAELWESQSRKFVHGTKYVSVIDAIDTSIDDERFFRYLLWNERPHLVQTAVEIPSIGAPYRHYARSTDSNSAQTSGWIARPPSPVSETHLGGLAMALPFWRQANDPGHLPNCLLIGAGGCSLAHTLTANLLHWNSSLSNSTQTDCLMTAVEASPEVVQASKLWFGAEPSSPPASFDLVCDTGELYLKSLVRDDKAPIDVLIVDAEDGSAPPASMRTLDFWTNTVLPTLSTNPVIGVNVIGSEFDVANLVQTLETVFSKHSKVLVVSPPSEANVSDRHKLIFVVPSTNDDFDCDDDLTHHELFLARDALRGCVDLPHAWEEQVRIAIRERFVVVDGKLTT